MDNSRQSALITGTAHVGVIGAGSIGSYLVPLLVKGGFGVTLWDDDDLYTENLAGGVFDARMISDGKKVPRSKISAITSITTLMTGETGVVDGKYERFTADTKTDVRILASGVDSMEARRAIWDWIKNHPGQIDLYIDGRIGGHDSTVWVVNPGSSESIAKYEPALTWEAADLPCGEKTTSYVCSWCSAMMMSAIIKHVNKSDQIGFAQLIGAINYSSVY